MAERNWTETVTIVSYESALSDPEVALPVPVPPGDPAPAQVRVVPGWLVAVALLLTASASLAALLWWQHRSRVIVISRLRPQFLAGADATGCPNRSRCQLRVDTGQALGTAARRLFPDATVLNSVSVSETDSGRTVLTSIVLRAPTGIQISATAQCIPGGSGLPGRAASLPQTGPAQADFVVAGPPGCSVAVSAQIPRAVPVPEAALRLLAADPDVQLSP